MSTPAASNPPRLRLRDWLQMAFVILLMYFVLPLLAAGTLDWPALWAYGIVGVIFTIISRGIVALRYPDLLAERARYAELKDTKEWDRRIMPLLAFVGPVGVVMVAGLDRRFGWSAGTVAPAWIITGWALILFGYVISTWALGVNRFFSALVRIQTDRGHVVIDSGPYRFVRHPSYSSAIWLYLGTALALESWWTLIPVALTAGVLILRTGLEDQTLQAELPGYAEYAQRTRYRLIPGIW